MGSYCYTTELKCTREEPAGCNRCEGFRRGDVRHCRWWRHRVSCGCRNGLRSVSLNKSPELEGHFRWLPVMMKRHSLSSSSDKSFWLNLSFSADAEYDDDDTGRLVTPWHGKRLSNVYINPCTTVQ